MKREDLLRSPEYWIANIQIGLYNCAENFMKTTGKDKAQLAKHLGTSEEDVNRLLNGDCDFKLTELVKLSLTLGYVPKLEFSPVDEYIKAQ